MLFPGTRVRGGATVAERASDRAYDVLRSEILSLRLAPGQLLPEVETAARIGVSRTPLREALSRLGADGLLVQEGGRGQVIAPVDSGQVRQLFELRQALDQQAARLAARRADPEVFHVLAERFAEVPEQLERDDPERTGYYALVRELDAATDAAVHNAPLVQALASVRTHLARIRRLAKDDNARLLAAAAEHREIAEAIAAADADLAASATQLHLHHSLKHVLRALSSEDSTA